MYTVFRFYFAADGRTDTAVLLELGRKANEIRPGFFEGLDRVEGRFSGSVADSIEWFDHVEAMNIFLDAMAPVIRVAGKSSIRGQFDVAVDDYDHRRNVAISSYLLPHELIAKMSQLGVDIVFSMYWSP